MSLAVETTHLRTKVGINVEQNEHKLAIHIGRGPDLGDKQPPTLTSIRILLVRSTSTLQSRHN